MDEGLDGFIYNSMAVFCVFSTSFTYLCSNGNAVLIDVIEVVILEMYLKNKLARKSCGVEES